MAKRGEVVDADSAQRIVEYFSEGARAIIWPYHLYKTALNNTHKIDLDSQPCQRDLVHCICMDEEIVAVHSAPVVRPDIGYMLGTFYGGFSYDGMFEGWQDAKVFVDSLELKARLEKKRKSAQDRVRAKGMRVADIIAVESFVDCKNLVESIEQLQEKHAALERAIKSGTALSLEETQEECLWWLWSCIALEKFAFSPAATVKRRPTFKQALNRDPSPIFSNQYPAIEIVNLRLPEKRENPDSKGRGPGIQFYVGGHFRRQWYPSMKAHQLIWIEEHVKGPKDAPLKPKPSKVYKVTR